MRHTKWERHSPRLYSIVTGFFPEASPKETWATDPRPLLVCGVAQDNDSKTFFCRVAYGTTQHIDKAHENDLVIGNMSMLNTLGLKRTTRFVIHSGKQMAILPWTSEFFSPWSGYTSPFLSCLPEDVQKVVGYDLSQLPDLPSF